MKPLNEMTAGELINFAQKHRLTMPLYESTSGLIEELCSKLKEATTPNPDEIHVWSVDDVYIQAKMMDVAVTLEQAREVLKRIDESDELWDAEIGITWMDINIALTDVLEGR